MPRGDGSGPQGMGPMTGRATGLCAGRGMGRGSGGGGGFGWRKVFRATGLPRWMRSGSTGSPEAANAGKTAEVDSLRGELERIRQRLDEIENRK